MAYIWLHSEILQLHATYSEYCGTYTCTLSIFNIAILIVPCRTLPIPVPGYCTVVNCNMAHMAIFNINTRVLQYGHTGIPVSTRTCILAIYCMYLLEYPGTEWVCTIDIAISIWIYHSSRPLVDYYIWQSR